MANAIVSNIGQVNGAGDTKALFLKVFSGEVLVAFEQKTVMLDKSSMRTISNGKSTSFPATGLATSGYVTPGEEILGGAIKHNERIITIDALLVSAAFVADIDDAMNNYDVSSIYSNEIGIELANAMDINILNEVIKASTTTSTVDGLPAGTVVKNTDFANSDTAIKAAALAEGVFKAGQVLDENNAPEERFAIFRPSEYNILVQNKDAINRDWGGEGSYAEGKVFRINGIAIVKSNNLSLTDTTATNAYHGVDATDTMGVVFTKESVGTVKLMDLEVNVIPQPEKNGTLLMGKYAMGHGVLRPECAVQLSKAV